MPSFIFDIGGVLVNFDVQRLLKKMSDGSGSAVTGLLDLWRNRIRYDVEAGKMSGREFFDKFIAKIMQEWSYEDWILAWMENYSINKNGWDLLLELKNRGFPVYILSNLADYNREAVDRKFPDMFKATNKNFFSFELGFLKPDAEIYLKACESMGARPEDCFFMDDFEKNVEGARRVGMRALQFSNEKIVEIREEIFKAAGAV
jgi:HAD superfamily hydrolase (TIGR01509 family)